MSRNCLNFLTLGIFAHANAGKTTITEHLLYHTNVISKIGRVDTGDTVTDSMSIERMRGITVRSSLVSFALGNKIVQLIDTPGHIDFSAEVERAISVLDGAVLVISGVEGLESQTFTIWKALKRKNVPVIIFINKIDRIGSDYNRVFNTIIDNLDRNVISLLDASLENDFLLCDDPSLYNLISSLSEIDDETLDLYINNKPISKEYIYQRMVFLIQNSLIYPVIGGSALKDQGISDLITCIGRYIPTTLDKYNQKFSAFAYMVRVVDNQKNIYAKILSGKINIRELIKVSEEKEEKLKGLYVTNGYELTPVDSAVCGEIVVINGINVSPGNLIGDKINIDSYVKFVKPLLSMQIVPDNTLQLATLVEALKILNEEDPYLNVQHEKITGDIYISLMGEVQAQVIKSLLEERFCIKSQLFNPVVVHKETPSSIGKGTASYTKVSSIELKVSPLPAGSGLIFKSEISVNILLKKYQRQAERLIKRFAQQGLYGWELIDAEVSLIDGRFNSVGSEPNHFNIAVPIALVRALRNSNIKILEPISKYILVTPKNYLAPVVQSLSSKSSIFEIYENDNQLVTIKGEVPLKNILNFHNELIKITSGKGTFTPEFSKYELSPDQNIHNKYFGIDPRNEVKFIIGDMEGSLSALDIPFTKKKKESRSKFQRLQQEKKNRAK